MKSALPAGGLHLQPPPLPSASCPWEEGGRLEKGVPRSLERRLTYMKMEYHIYQPASDRSLGNIHFKSISTFGFHVSHVVCILVFKKEITVSMIRQQK